MNCSTAYVPAMMAEILGNLMSETELPLPSLPTEYAASDFVLSDYFLTNDLLLLNPQQ